MIKLYYRDDTDTIYLAYPDGRVLKHDGEEFRSTEWYSEMLAVWSELFLFIGAL